MMTFHRLMIAAALLLAAMAMKLYLPAESSVMLSSVRALICEQEYALPAEAVQWLDGR